MVLSEDTRRLLEDPDVWHPVRSALGNLFKYPCLGWPTVRRALWRATTHGRLIITALFATREVSADQLAQLAA
jgi:hypothetical protein